MKKKKMFKVPKMKTEPILVPSLHATDCPGNQVHDPATGDCVDPNLEP